MSYFTHLTEVLGFDRSVDNEDGTYRVRCSACEALVINGTPCHETGCSQKSWECRECGSTLPAGQSCDCMEPCYDGDPDEYQEED